MKKIQVLIIIVFVLILSNSITESETKSELIGEPADYSSVLSPDNGGKIKRAVASPDIIYDSKSTNHLKIIALNNNIYITDNDMNFDLTKYCEVSAEPTSSKFLVNKDTALEKDNIKVNLTDIDSRKIILEHKGLKLGSSAATALYSMLSEARRDGIKGFVLNSAYRSEASQKEIFDYNLNVFKKSSKTYKEALEKTNLLVASPGFSEHQTGLAVDIFSVNGRHRSDFEGTKEQIWLDSNAYKYGFIMRYGSDKTHKTGATYEPWHFRYTGIPLSTYLFSNNLCLEEFYQKIFSGNILEGKDCLFMKVDRGQKVYWEGSANESISLETVKKGVLLLTVNYKI